MLPGRPEQNHDYSPPQNVIRLSEMFLNKTRTLACKHQNISIMITLKSMHRNVWMVGSTSPRNIWFDIKFRRMQVGTFRSLLPWENPRRYPMSRKQSGWTLHPVRTFQWTDISLRVPGKTWRFVGCAASKLVDTPTVKVHPCTGTEALYRPYGP